MNICHDTKMRAAGAQFANNTWWQGQGATLAIWKILEKYGTFIIPYTLQGTNISHQWERKFIFPTAFGWDMLVPGRVIHQDTEHRDLWDLYDEYGYELA